MNTRQATIHDLPQLKTMYRAIVHNLDERNICIWDDYYPCEVLAEDVANDRLYVLEKYSEMVAAFALCEAPENVDCLAWQDKHAQTLYLYRFGVSVHHARKGIGGTALHEAEALAKSAGAAYLRLLVVDINQPAIRFYEKNGYQKVEGIRDEPLGDTVLWEYGFERKLV